MRFILTAAAVAAAVVLVIIGVEAKAPILDIYNHFEYNAIYVSE